MIVSEIMESEKIELIKDFVDVFQIGKEHAEFSINNQCCKNYETNIIKKALWMFY